MKKRQKLLTDEQWELIEPLLPEPRRRRDNRGRPWAPNRACFEGILWILQTGAAWRFLPDEFPSPATCWRRLKQWEDEGVWLDAWRALLGALDEEGLLNWDETFLDGSFAPAKKGALPSVKPSVARGRSGWYWSTVKVFRWEFGWKVPLRQKLRLRKPRSPKSTSRACKDGRGKSPSASSLTGATTPTRCGND
jgi:transposase